MVIYFPPPLNCNALVSRESNPPTKRNKITNENTQRTDGGPKHAQTNTNSIRLPFAVVSLCLFSVRKL